MSQIVFVCSFYSQDFISITRYC